MVGDGDGAAGTVGLANRKVLLKGGSALNRGLIDLLMSVDVVGRTVAGDGADLSETAAGVVVAEGFDDVVLDKRVLEPAIDRQVSIAVGGEFPAEGDRSEGKL